MFLVSAINIWASRNWKNSKITDLTHHQISLAATCMLTLIAFRFAIGVSIPKLSYLTRLDEFILWSTLLIFLTLLEAVYTSTYTKYGKFNQTLKIDRQCRWIFPIIFILVAIITLGA